jgi:hypothetical protein
MTSPEEDAKARCLVPRPEFAREHEPIGERGYFKSIPAEQTQPLDSSELAHNRELLTKMDTRGRKPATPSTEPEEEEERKTG